MKILPVGADFFHVDGRTGMTKLIVAFCDFARAPLAGQLMLCREVIAKCTVWAERRISGF